MDIIQEYGLPGYKFQDIAVRHIEEKDIEALIQLFKSNYGEDYPLTAFYDANFIKSNIYNDQIIWLVLEEERKLAASGAILLNAGDYNDQVGEIGRLVVHKEMQGRNLGRRMINALFEAADDTVEFAYGEARTFHPISQILMAEADFKCIGFVPLKYDLGTHIESIAFYGTLYGNARALRREERPQIIKPFTNFANTILGKFQFDMADSVQATAYINHSQGLSLRKLERDDIKALLQLRHIKEQPLCFGSLNLEQGLSYIRRKKAQYVVVERDGIVVGALGYLFDRANGILKINELLSDDKAVRAYLCQYFSTELADSLKAKLITANISAYEPQLQQTLFDYGFRMVSYAPSLAFYGFERFDSVKMCLFRHDPKTQPTYKIQLTDEVKKIADMVLESFS